MGLWAGKRTVSPNRLKQLFGQSLDMLTWVLNQSLNVHPNQSLAFQSGSRSIFLSHLTKNEKLIKVFSSLSLYH